jgi:F-type H+-transporting ATPase subunit delta
MILSINVKFQLNNRIYMLEYKVSYRYAKALIETAVKQGVSDQIFEDFKKVDETYKMSRELRSLTVSPVFQQWRKKKIYNEVFSQEKISQLTLNFLIMLIDKRRGELIPSIVAQYIVQYNILNNKLVVEIQSAVELTDDLKNKIISRLTEWSNKTILPNYIINKSLKSGLLVRIDDWVFDASLRNQLNILYKELAGAN